jgi:hypothetical protein
LRRNKLNNRRSENRKYRYAERKAMPLTKLDITAALIVIDLQKGVVGLPTFIPRPRSSLALPGSRGRSANEDSRSCSST